MIKIAADANGQLRGNDAWLRAVVIQGQIDHRLSADSDASKLEPGSYFGTSESATHEIACRPKQECLIYVSTEGKYRFAGM